MPKSAGTLRMWTLVRIGKDGRISMPCQEIAMEDLSGVLWDLKGHPNATPGANMSVSAFDVVTNRV